MPTRVKAHGNSTFVANTQRSQTMIGCFEAQVLKTPENVALVLDQDQCTYQELYDRTIQITATLQAQGVRHGDVIGLAIDRSLDMIAGMLAILKAGAAYMPLDASYPTERLRSMLEECNAQFILTDDTFLPDIPAKFQGINVAEIKEGLGTLEKVRYQPTDLAYIIYTSGSTGRPKGVMVEHRSVVNLIHSQIDTYGITSDDRILQFSSMTFDASVEQIGLALLSGAACVLIRKDTLGGAYFRDYLVEYQVTHVDVTPTFLESVGAEFPDSVKRIVVGGEACNAKTIEKLYQTQSVFNAYGPTEATVTSMLFEVSANEPIGRTVPIGKPIANTRVYLLDKDQKQVEPGATGEIYVAGACLARGYLNEETLTRTRFLPDPWVAGDRMYKTGDLGRLLADGNVEFQGRVDDQVKIRGFRIELGEIKSQITALERVKDCSVQSYGEGAQKKIIAYYVAEGGLTELEIRTHLNKFLPPFMIPDQFMLLDELPMNISGKIDRHALPNPDRIHQKIITPRNPTEERLVQLWAELLEVDGRNISVDQNFLQMGGNSLLVMSLVNKIVQKFQIKLTYEEFFKRPTVQTMAEFIDFNQWISQDTSKEAGDKTEVII